MSFIISIITFHKKNLEILYKLGYSYFLLHVLCLFNFPSYAQTSCPKKIPLVNIAVKAVAFYEGIRYNVEKISVYNSPNLNELQGALLRFEIRFKSARDSAENVLKSSFKDYNDIYFFSENRKLIDSLYTSIKLDDFSAVKYKDYIQGFLDGTNPSKEFEYLLSFKYKNNPIEEFRNGHTNTYSTLNHSKAKGTNWQIKYPRSWLCMEGDRPNIITKIVNDFGNGTIGVLLAVKDLPNYTASKKEIETFFTEKSAKELIPENSEFISFKKIVIEGLPAGKLIYSTKVQRMDFTMEIYTVNYSFIYKSKYYFVVGTISNFSSQANDILIRKYQPVFDLIFNSVVINDKYK
jgi:hypothetical protein